MIKLSISIVKVKPEELQKVIPVICKQVLPITSVIPQINWSILFLSINRNKFIGWYKISDTKWYATDGSKVDFEH